ncbi:hypothetical protein [Bradyrhizobium roseum]|uniref:hypothetical protein n=1 Tax=Bradyrhizobium roseum TaxID=3056648 RepID=UPI0026380167|nr:hypothetical protein [Bradyrhizobium roseus]WKA27840.1 hypothetical protein QUH67_30460 [Bradyrhizobium roseus]
MEMRTSSELLPAGRGVELGLSRPATYASAAQILLGAFAGQTAVPLHYEFPRKASIPDPPAIRELQPQPSDDSAFQP